MLPGLYNCRQSDFYIQGNSTTKRSVLPQQHYLLRLPPGLGAFRLVLLFLTVAVTTTGPSQTSRQNVWKREVLLGDTPIPPSENNVCSETTLFERSENRKYLEKGEGREKRNPRAIDEEGCAVRQATRLRRGGDRPNGDHCCSKRA